MSDYNLYLTLQMQISEEQLRMFYSINKRKRLFAKDIRSMWYNLTKDENIMSWHTETIVEMLNFQLKEHGYNFTAYYERPYIEGNDIPYWKISKPKYK